MRLSEASLLNIPHRVYRVYRVPHRKVGRLLGSLLLNSPPQSVRLGQSHPASPLPTPRTQRTDAFCTDRPRPRWTYWLRIPWGVPARALARAAPNRHSPLAVCTAGRGARGLLRADTLHQLSAAVTAVLRRRGREGGAVKVTAAPPSPSTWVA